MALVNRAMNHMSSGVQEAGRAIQHSAHETMDYLGDTASDMLQQSRRQARHLVDSLEDSVQNHPVRWLLIGIGFGCLISAAFTRR